MAKKRPDDAPLPPAAEDITAVGDAPEGDGPDSPPADPRDAEIAALRAMLADRDAELEKAKAAGSAASPASPAGQKFRVSLTGGCTAVVETRAGEHPFEAYKRLTGVINSIHTPVIQPAPKDAACGVVRHDGRITPFPAASA